MPPKLPHRDVAGFLSRVRDFFLGRTHKTAHRFADTVSPRTQPAPDIPQGPSQSLFANYYYMRDPRGQLKPVVDLMQDHKKNQVTKEKAAGTAKDAEPKVKGDCDEKDQEADGDSAKKLPTPGRIHSWEGPN